MLHFNDLLASASQPLAPVISLYSLFSPSAICGDISFSTLQFTPSFTSCSFQEHRIIWRILERFCVLLVNDVEPCGLTGCPADVGLFSEVRAQQDWKDCLHPHDDMKYLLWHPVERGRFHKKFCWRLQTSPSITQQTSAKLFLLNGFPVSPVMFYLVYLRQIQK